MIMEVFVARQPIFTINEEVFGYELLYRSSQDMNAFPNINEDQATAELIINSFLNIGIDKLSGGKPCFINFTENLLKLKLPTYFRPLEIVVEILESVGPSMELIEICQELKELGYSIALDDFVLDENNIFTKELFNYIDFVKVDFLSTSIKMREEIEKLANEFNVKLLAEKLESHESYEDAKKRGYHLFQGFFFSKPIVISSKDVPTNFHSYYELIQHLSVDEPLIERITEIIEMDLSLSYKLLKLINSPGYRPRQRISSIRQAIVMLGFTELQKWIYVLAVRESTNKKTDMSHEIILHSLIRAKMCEEIGRLIRSDNAPSSHFLTGMFSLMDTILSKPIEEILTELPLSEEICDALSGKQNRMKEVLDLAIAVETAQWEVIREKCCDFNIDGKVVFDVYSESLTWANKLVLNKV